MSPTIRATGIPWYRKEDYVRLKNLFIDGHDLPLTFDEWQQQAQDLFDGLKSKGHIVEKVYIEPDPFTDWCLRRGLDINANARVNFANEFVARIYAN